MSAFKQSLRRIPYWAYLLVLVSIFVITVYIYYRGKMTMSGSGVKFGNGYYTLDYVKTGDPVYNAGIRTGDTLVSMNSIPIEEWEAGSYYPKPGDTITSGILRNNKETQFTVYITSERSSMPVFFWSIYIIMMLFSLGSLYLLYKKPNDKAVRLLFIYIQFFIVTLNAQSLGFKDPLAMIATVTFMTLGGFLGPILIHFHLLFPRPTKIIKRYKNLPLLFYMPATLIVLGCSASYIHDWIKDALFGAVFIIFIRISLWWLTISFILALAIAIYQFFTVRDTLSRNQLRIVITGAFFSCITPISLALFYEQINEFSRKFFPLEPISQGIGGVIMICCFLIAIFRYRIWNIEVFIRKALQYLGATLVIILSYLVLIYLVDLLTISQNNITRFLILAISVILFLIIRDWIQRIIDRIFHRESFDSATVVSDFETKLAGIYHFEELNQKIVSGLDEIFHFKWLVFNLKKNDLIYEPVFALGVHELGISGEFDGNNEFEQKLRKSKVFSPDELSVKPSIFDIISGELVVPLLAGGQPNGFFLCGPKKSEKTYSMQDIRVLSLIAKRVIALFHTASLYQKDLDRQLMLERERARISQDMHDDVGASLTRISMMSDLVKNRTDVGGGARQWLGQISDTSRGLMEEMNQIIWALNPKNDNLEGLIAYVRRFAFEYLEPTSISCVFDFPEEMPDRALSVEVRRNVYLVAREAIHNVVKHADATKVWISLGMNGLNQPHPPSPSPLNDLTPLPPLLKERGRHGEKALTSMQFMITIKDNGKGFDSGKVEFPGNGLVNMKKRMNDIGGELHIISKKGEGTEIKLFVLIK